ncbi:MAG: SulP family inorganic anion transporter [Cyanobacteria bacterium J06573_11]
MARKIKIHGLHLRNLRGDLFGGITAAIVALPLALAFGVSSGAGATAGLYGAIAIGFFAALFGGTPSQISGPTGPMTVVMATVFTGLIAKYPENGLALAFTVVMLGGLFQICFGLLRLGEYITLMPYTVISGFMSGIGVIIFTLQLAPLFGQLGSSSVVESIQQLPEVILAPNMPALGLGLLTLLIVFGMPARLNRILPAPLVALVVGTVASLFIVGDIPRIGPIPSGLPDLHLPVLDRNAIKDMLGYGLVLATLGAIDSLLTSLVADNITHTQHDSDRELIGQGIGNMISGLVGGLPGAGATMRTVINVKSGGKTPISGMVHASILAAVLLGAGPLTAKIPLAVLAGILIKVGIDIIDWSFLKRAHVVSRKAALLMYGVLFLTVFVDLITAVAAGAFVANLLTVKTLTDEQRQHVHAITAPTDESLTDEERRILADVQGRVLLFSLSGPMSFGAAKTISQRMTIVNRYEVLILDLAEVPRLGVTASLAIENMVREACDRHLMVYVVGAKGPVKERLGLLHVFDDLPSENLLSSRLEALQQASEQLRSLSPMRYGAEAYGAETYGAEAYGVDTYGAQLDQPMFDTKHEQLVQSAKPQPANSCPINRPVANNNQRSSQPINSSTREQTAVAPNAVSDSAD